MTSSSLYMSVESSVSSSFFFIVGIIDLLGRYIFDRSLPDRRI